MYQSEWLESKRQEITSVGEDVEKKEPSRTFSGNVNWCSHCGKHFWKFLKKLKTELTYDLVIPLLAIYPKKKPTKFEMCLLQHYLQKRRCGSRPNVHPQMNG